MIEIPEKIKERIAFYSPKLEKYPKLQSMYQKAFVHTLTASTKRCNDGTYYIVTGDIPAMWLRDSSAQVHHYIPLSKDDEVAEILEGLLRRQLMYIEIDPYANAFNEEANGAGDEGDYPPKNKWVWERKYEIDSICYPMRLLYMYWRESGRTDLIQSRMEKIATIILDLWETEQYHMEKSTYRFIRNTTNEMDTIPGNGMGSPVVPTGMTWCGFRPSDDGCRYGYYIASEMFAVVVLGYMSEMLREVCNNQELADRCIKLRDEIDQGIKKYGTTEHPKYGQIYVCETDGMGNCVTYDDANIPSLLSIPYLGYADKTDPIYQNTRRFLLSKDHKYYYEGKFAKGIGSSHTPENYVWHMAIVMQGLTSCDDQEKREVLDMLARTDADTGYLHEGFHVDDPWQYTRWWFTWPNSLFAEYIEKCIEEGLFDE